MAAFGSIALSAQDAVELHIGDELKQVRVEALDEATNRWLAIASGYRDHADTGWLKVGLPEGFEAASLRVLGSTQASPFAGQMESARVADAALVDYLPAGPEAFNDAGRGGEEKVIEEPDIWSWDGSTLYFYNQYRGLQVIDLTDPAEPEWLDYFRYPAKGEDLYAFDDGTIVLIGTGAYWSGDTVALQFLSLDGDTLSLDETVELETGQYMDSRRYGDFLYVMTREWRRELNPDGQEINSPRIHLYSIALGETTEERIVDIQSFDANGWVDAVLTAQQDGILICLNRWVDGGGREWRYRWHTEVNVLVPDENGVPELVGVAPLVGIIRDKFKLKFEDGLLTAISQQADWSNGQFSRTTYLENFDLGESGFRKVGSLELAPGETLFATRFYGDTIYIVTFLVVDPLFSIDNSIPSQPRVAGELKVPGWSNYLEWVDDQLFAVGIEDRRLTVSIFDVGDPENMSLKDRVFLNEDSWAWSEAQYDDQAISFFPEEQLLMLPFTTWSWESSEQIQAMQLISWDDSGLQLRGAIQHLDTPRRGTLLDQNVVTISGREVVVTDISDPDLPVYSGKETLAWNASWLIPHEDYLIQLEAPENGCYWRGPYSPETSTDPVLYVTSLDSPNIPAAEVPLDSGKLLGAALKNGQLILLQDVSEDPQTEYWEVPEKQSIAVRLYSLANPLAPELLGESVAEDLPYLGNSFSPHPVEGSIVWSSKSNPFYGIYYDFWWPGPWGFGNTLSYLVTTAGSGVNAYFVSAHDSFNSEGLWGNNSQWFWEAPRLLASQTSYTEHPRPDRGYPDYEAKTELVAVDFSRPYEPLLLPAAELPANLASVEALPDGLNHILYFEPSWNLLEAWGWDGVNAFLLVRQKIGPDEWSRDSSYSFAWFPPFHARQRSEYENGQSTSFLDVWAHDAGMDAFKLAGEFSFENEWLQSATEMAPHYLVATNRNLHVFNGVRYTPDEGGIESAGWLFDLRESVPFPFPNIYNMQLDDARLVDGTLYIPTGLYGVEVLELSPSVTEVASSGSYRNLEDSNGWTQLDESAWQRVARAETDGAGAINRFNWLYRPDSLTEIDPGATDAGDFWRQSEWFGWYAYRANDPAWIQHLEHGLMYSYVGDAPDVDGIYFYDTVLGYTWTRGGTYPWLYRYDTQEWAYYLNGSGLDGMRWFYGLTSGWQSFD